jgi:molybdopterin synthase catalytic subunit
MRAAIVRDKLDIAKLIDEVAADSNGATAVFLGTVRAVNEGRAVTAIEYSAYDEMAELEMTRILGEAADSFGIESAAVEHRIGELGIGDASIAVVVAHPHRAPALDALRYIIDETKARVPVWKLEHYVDGTREWVGAGSGEAR